MSKVLVSVENTPHWDGIALGCTLAEDVAPAGCDRTRQEGSGDRVIDWGKVRDDLRCAGFCALVCGTVVVLVHLGWKIGV